jgi:GNAT superfamily N-acetyltransferase
MTELQILRTMHPPEIFIEQMALLNNEIGRTISTSFLREKIEALPREDRLLLAVEGEFLIGYAHLSIRKDLAGPDPVEIVDLIVRKANRRRGIGRQLLNAAETWARQSNRSSLVVKIPVADTTAHAFLSALHFDQNETMLSFVRAL